MATTQNTFTGNGSNLGPFSFTFKWLEPTDIKVSVGGVLKTAGTHYNLQNLNYTTKTGGEVLFTSGNAPANAAAIRVFRDTDDSALSATFNSGSAIRAQDLNDNFTQNLYVTQEINNNAVQIDGSQTMVGDLNMGGYKITNLATPTASGNAATKDYVDASSGNGGIPGHTRWRRLATAGQTTFSGTGDYGGTLSYSPVREQVYLNGALQQRNADYSADNGTSITFTEALQLNDVVDVVCTNNLVSGTVSNAANINYSGQFSGQTTRTVAAKLADVVSVKDFGAVGDGVTDDTAALQAFFTYIAANDVGTAYCSGTFLVSAPITFGTGTSTATKHIIGDAYIQTSTTIDTLFTINGFTLGVWDGFIAVQGTGSVSYASRTCGTGLVITNSGRATFTALRASRFRLYGIKVTSGTPGGNTTLVNLGDVDVSDCGTGYPGGSNLTATWSNPVNTGSSNSTSQRTTIDVSTLPTYVSENTVVLINGETYYVYSVDSVNNKLTIFPWIDGALTSGSLTYIQGAGLFVLGSDAGVVNADMVDATRCSVGLWSRALYGIIAKRVVTQYCLSGFAVGENPSAAAVTFSLNGFYCEANTIDLLRITRSEIGGIITAEYAFDFSKVKYTTDARPTGALTYTNTYNNLRTITIQTVQGFKRWKRTYSAESASTTGLDLASKNSSPDDLTVYYRDSWTVNLIAESLYTYTYGDRSRTICFIGSGTNNAPTGTITFNAHSGGTVNGGASAAFSGFTGPALFYAYFNASTNDVIIACPNQIKRGSVTWNPPSIADGASASTTVTCTGAVLGDYTQASFSLSLDGLSLSSYVSAADQVTVVLTNNTGGAVDLASGTVRVTATKSI